MGVDANAQYYALCHAGGMGGRAVLPRPTENKELLLLKLPLSSLPLSSVSNAALLESVSLKAC